MAQNQTLRINIELPAGVELRSMTGVESGSGNESWSAIYGENYAMIAEDGSLLPLRWIMIQTYENSQFLLELKNQNVSGKLSFIYFLNDNTNYLQSAQPLKEFPALLNFNQKGLLIRNFKPKRTTLKAWLGYYGENQFGSLLLEYFRFRLPIGIDCKCLPLRDFINTDSCLISNIQFCAKSDFIYNYIHSLFLLVLKSKERILIFLILQPCKKKMKLRESHTRSTFGFRC